jgi:hypothetical protein
MCCIVDMLKHIDDIRKSARERAARRWKNHQIEKNFKADVHEQDKLLKEGMTKFESKFIKYIREMMEGHSKVNLEMYLHSLEGKKRLLLREKLRRLQLAQLVEAQQNQQKEPKGNDLFG